MALPARGPVLYLLWASTGCSAAPRACAAPWCAIATAPPSRAAEPGGHLAPLARLVGQVVEAAARSPATRSRCWWTAPRPTPRCSRRSSRRAPRSRSPPTSSTATASARSSSRRSSARTKRGVAVRVLVDDVDARFSWSSGVQAAASAPASRSAIFNPPFVPARLNAFNLRNHRKILVVDGALGFTGGMNIDQRYWRPEAPAEAFRDLHFRLRGPVVAQLAEVFADDWQFATDEALRGAPWFVPLDAAGPCIARVIEAGPDEGFEQPALGDRRRAGRSAALGARPHALLHPGQRLDHRAERRGAARHGGRHRAAGDQRPAARAMGGVRPAVAGARPRLPRLDSAAGRSITRS